MEKRRIVKWFAVVLLLQPLAGCGGSDVTADASVLQESQAVVVTRENSVGDSQDLCFFSPGDLNGDGLEDYAISTPWTQDTLSGQRRARIVYGDGIPRQKADFIDADVEKFPGLTLTGAQAAPFLCGPTGEVMKNGRGTTRLQAKEPAVKPFRSPVAHSTLNPNPLQGPPRYEMINLSELSPGKYSNASGVGPSGKVVGTFLTLVGGGYYEEHAYLYEDGALRDLGTLGGHYSSAHDINSSDQVVGYSLTGGTDEMGFINAAFLWDGNMMGDLGISHASASKINDAGQIVGEISYGTSIMAFLHDKGTTTELGSLDGRGSWALSINNEGQIVGNSSAVIPDTQFRSNRAFLYQHGALTDLGSLGVYCYSVEGHLECFENSSATDINDKGQIVGYSSLPDTFSAHAFRISDQGMEDLGTLGGMQSWAQAVNESGQIVGSSMNADDSGYHAFLYDQGKMYDLNDLNAEPSSGAGHIWGASDINDFGQIVGSSFLLNPLYPTISPGNELTFSTTLGSHLSFEYWFTMGNQPNRCVGNFPRPQVQIKLSAPGIKKDIISQHLRPYLNSWMVVGTSGSGCGSSQGWTVADVSLPSVLKGQTVDITFRVREHGRTLDPNVHLRHFNSN
ncbi:MAG: DUF3466 family protein [Trichloromonadaceae bacterium]